MATEYKHINNSLYSDVPKVKLDKKLMFVNWETLQQDIASNFPDSQDILTIYIGQ